MRIVEEVSKERLDEFKKEYFENEEANHRYINLVNDLNDDYDEYHNYWLLTHSLKDPMKYIGVWSSIKEALRERKQLMDFIVEYLLTELDVEDEVSSNVEIITKYLKKYLELKESMKALPFKFADKISTESKKQMIRYIGDQIGEDIFEQIKNSEDQEFDVIFSVLPKREKNESKNGNGLR